MKRWRRRRRAAHRGFVADGALDHVLMQLPIQVDDGIADAAVDDGHAAGVRAGDGRVWRGQFCCGMRRKGGGEGEEEKEKTHVRIKKKICPNYSQSVPFLTSQGALMSDSGAGSAGGCKQRANYSALGIVNYNNHLGFKQDF